MKRVVENAGCSVEDVRAQLHRIVTSTTFAGALRLIRFLHFIVEETLQGRSEQIKELSVAADVYRKDITSDARPDSTVRADASKLRVRLARYYEVEGASDRVIITVPRGSYVPLFTLQEAVVPPRHSSDRSRVIALAAAGIIAAAAVLSAAFWTLRVRGDVPVAFVPVTSLKGREISPAVSPDGSQVAFVWDGETQDNEDIYVKTIDGTALLRLTSSPERDEWPTWSPDGRLIAFTRSGKELFLTSPLGGPERKVPVGLKTVGLPSWTRDSRSLLVVGRENGGSQETFAIFRVMTESGKTTQLTAPHEGIGDVYVRAAPDGASFVFIRALTPGLTHLYAARLQGDAPPVALLRAPTWINGFDFLPSGNELVLSSNHSGTRALWRMPLRAVSPEELKPVPFAGAGAYFPTVSGTGNLIFQQVDNDVDIVEQRLNTNAPPISVASSTRLDQGPKYSPDGSKIAFLSQRSGFREIWTAAPNGSSLVQVTTMKQPELGSPRWSPDGNYLAFHSIFGNYDIYVVSATGSHLIRLTSNPGVEMNPTWSPDGHWIYFSSDWDGQPRIWKIPAQGGNAERIADSPGLEAFEVAGDGLYVVNVEELHSAELWRMSPATGRTKKLFSARLPSNRVANSAAPCWTLSGTGFFVLTQQSAKPETSLERFDIHSGVKQVLARFPSAEAPSGFDVSMDGKSLLRDKVIHRGADLVMVRNLR